MKKTHSFANRLTLKVLRTVLLLMFVTLVMTFIAAYRSMRGETVGRYLGMRSVVSEKINLEIKTIEIGARNVVAKVAGHMESPEAVMSALDREIRLNDFADGYFAAFEPNYFTNAGHESPFVVGAPSAPGHVGSEARRLKMEPNVALGVERGFPFAAEEIPLKPGTLLFLYTDGLTDAATTSGERFEHERIKAVLQQTAEGQQDKDIASYVRTLADEVTAYVGDAPQADDLTMLAVRWNGCQTIWQTTQTMKPDKVSLSTG